MSDISWTTMQAACNHTNNGSDEFVFAVTLTVADIVTVLRGLGDAILEEAAREN